jgi:tRNA modification GTPase
MKEAETIVALSTPQGEGAIGIIRLSGPNAVKLTARHTNASLLNAAANSAVFSRFRINEVILDEVVVTIFKAPKSYTGEDVCEISFHGSAFILNQALEALLESGARLATPGEFTQRAFLNGKMDLSQAEAVADLIASESEAEHRLAMHQMRGGFSREIAQLRQELINFTSLIELELDFAEEDVEFANRDQLKALIQKIQAYIQKLVDSFRYGNAVKQGVPVAIIGQPNAGKSTLLNLLLNDDKAIVSEIAGTTRDAVEDICIVEGIRFRFIDTAGIRETTDIIEAIGVKKSLEKMRGAAIVIYLFDARESKEEHIGVLDKLNLEMDPATVVIAVANKIDLSDKSALADIQLSAKTGEGLDQLRRLLVDSIKTGSVKSGDVVVTNARHLQALKATGIALDAALHGIESGLSGDLVSSDIREALHQLGSITGEISAEELLGNIFGKFCIGK